MVRTITLSVVAVLLISSGALGAVGDIGNQSQTWNLGLGNTVIVSTGGSAGTSQHVGTLNTQSVVSTTGSFAGQSMGALLVQSGGAISSNGAMTVGQTLTVDGAGLQDPVTGAFVAGPGQQQSVGVGSGQVSQFEGVQVTAANSLTKAALGGVGVANGQNTVSFGMHQSAANDDVLAFEGSTINGGQTSGIMGGAGTSASVTSTITAVVVQEQVVN